MVKKQKDIVEKYQERVGYNYNSIDIYPTTVKQQLQLKQLFELLEINVPPPLFGHTKIFIATKELKGKISKLMEESFETDIENRCTTCDKKLPKNHPPTEADCKKCRDENV